MWMARIDLRVKKGKVEKTLYSKVSYKTFTSALG